jgi:carboxymethylenebutenolidase
MAELDEGPQQATVERVTVTSGDGTDVPAIHAVPEGGASTGVVVHPDIMGIRPLFDDLCRRVATHGHAVACPEPFVRAPDDVRAAEEPQARTGYVSQLDDERQVGDLVASADWLTEHDRVDRVHVMGFCMGGMQTLKAAATGRFRRAVAFYGMVRLPDGWAGPKVRGPLETAADVCPTLAIFGGADAMTPAADIEALREVWRDRDDCEIVVYPDAEHGFVHAPERPAHRADDAANVWRRALAWLSA